MVVNGDYVLDVLMNNHDTFLHPNQALSLTSQLVDLINTYEYHQDGVDVFLERLSSTSALKKLLHLLESTKDPKLLTDVITILHFITQYRKGKNNINLSESRLWVITLELAVRPLEFLPKEAYFSLLEILIHYFKNKLHVETVCSSSQISRALQCDVIDLLYSKNVKNKKTAQKRRKTATSLLSNISRLKEGQKLISNLGLVEKLHSYLLQISTEKSYDAVVHNIGQTILRCVPLQNLPGMTDGYSAYVYRSFGSLPGANEVPRESSDSSEDSEDDEDDEGEEDDVEDESESSNCSGNSQPSRFSMSHRTPEELEQYRHIFEDVHMDNEPDALKTIYHSVSLGWSRSQLYEGVARCTKSVCGFKLIPCPDWANANGNFEAEKLYTKDRLVCRKYLMKTLSIAMNPHVYQPVLVYNLDTSLLSPDTTASIKMIDVEALSSFSNTSNEVPLVFESRFENGNLRRAYKVGEREYDLILNSDVNSSGRQQWFYFRISGNGIRSSIPYTFNILNFEKQRSLFNQGMKPVMFSVKEYVKTGQAVWKRIGTNICYYRNVFRQNMNHQSYWTLSFDVTFPFDNDVLYIAYHYPYTYSQLMTDVLFWQREYQVSSQFQLRVSKLCSSPCENPIPVLWLSRLNTTKKSVSFISARVHPVESCSSWCIRGAINAALNDMVKHGQSFQTFPSLCVLPMLNVDGTIHGCARTEVTNEDLNRKWLKPSEKYHPTIYHAKGLIEFIRRSSGTSPTVLCDMHGHSRRFNAFLYGCQSVEHNQEGTRQMTAGTLPRTSKEVDDDVHDSLPVFVRLLKSNIPEYLDVSQCSWKMEESRESTARIVGWRHHGISNSYTLECSMAGYYQYPEEEWIHFNTVHYGKIGLAVYRTVKQMMKLS